MLPLVSYQLTLCVQKTIIIQVGKLGLCRFDTGRYIYTGSAKRYYEARIARHLRADKKRHWHIDYLLACPDVTIERVERSATPECLLNQSTAGIITVPLFGATDCHAGCGSHLKHLADAAYLTASSP